MAHPKDVLVCWCNTSAATSAATSLIENSQQHQEADKYQNICNDGKGCPIKRSRVQYSIRWYMKSVFEKLKCGMFCFGAFY